MAIPVLDCAGQSNKNFYQTECDSVFKEVQMLIFTKNNVDISYPYTDSSIKDLIKQKKAFPVPVVTLNADNSAEAVTEETNGIMSYVKDGERRYKFQVKANVCTFDALIDLEKTFKGVYLVDKSNRLGGILDQSNDKIVPVPLNTFRCDPKPILMNGTELAKYMVNVHVDGEYIRENQFAYVKSSIPILFSNIDGLKDIKMGDGTGSTTSKIIVTAKLGCGGENVFGLVDSDFKITKDADKSDVSISSVAEVDGKYELSATTQVGTYSVGLKSPTDQASGEYESDTVQITIS